MMALDALRGALRALRQAGTPLVLLRARSFDAAAAACGDFDLLAPSRAFAATAASLVEALLDRPVSVRVHAAKPEKRLVEILDGDGGRLQVDLWREHRIGGEGGGRTARVIHERVAASCTPDPGLEDVLRLPPWLEVALFCCHLADKRKDLQAAGVRDRIDRYRTWSAVGGGPQAASDLPRSLESLASGAGDSRAAAAVGRTVLAQAGLLQPLAWPGERITWGWRRRKLSIARRLGAGPVIAVQGPDGAGKTTIIEALAAAGGHGKGAFRRSAPELLVFKRLYRRSVFRWLYKAVRKLRRLRDRDEPKEVVEAALSPFLFAGALINYRLLRLFTRKRRGVIVDRFFPDLLVTNRKAGADDLRWTGAARWLAPVMPRADAAVLLAADPEVLRSRKAEMTAGNAARYLRLLVQHHVRRPPRDFLVLRTDIPLERSLEVLQTALDNVR